MRTNMVRCHKAGHGSLEPGTRHADGRLEGRCPICGAYRYVRWNHETGYEWRSPRGRLLGYS